MTRPKLFTAILALALAAPAFAQEPAINARLRLLAFAGDMENPEIFIHDPAAPPEAAPVKAEIKSYLNSDAAVVPLKSRKIMFSLANTRDSLTKEGQLLGEVTLPAGGDSSIILFLPNKPGAKAKYLAMAVPDSIQAFPPGSFHVTNLSPFPVRLELEKKPFDFKPGQSSILKELPSKSNSEMGMRCYALIENAWKEVSSSIWNHPGKSRSFMILFQDPSSGGVRLRSFDDVKPD